MEHLENLKPHPEALQKAVRAVSAKIAGVEDPKGLKIVQDEEANLRKAIAFMAAEQEYEDYDAEMAELEDEELGDTYIPERMSREDILALSNSLGGEEDIPDPYEAKFPLLDASEVLMVGDSASDILAGKAFGCKTVALTGEWEIL